MSYFSTRTFDIQNHNFLDLNLLVSKSEENDFSIKERTFNNKILMEQIYLVALQEILKESQEDLPKAKKKFIFVALYSRAYQLALAFVAMKCLYVLSMTLYSTAFDE